MQRGVTLVELVMTLTLIGLTLALMVPHLAHWADRLAVDRAAHEVATFYHRGRFSAIMRATRVRLEFRSDSLRAVFEGAVDSTAFVWPGPARHGAQLSASRAVIRLYPTGFGLGAANTKLVIRRGAAAESLTTSRLGRLKRW